MTEATGLAAVSPADGQAAEGDDAAPPVRPDRARSLRARVWQIVDAPHHGDPVERGFEIAILVLIALNVAAVVLQSVRDLELRFGRAFHAFEVLSVLVFSAEYLARLWSCVEDPRFRGAVRGRLRLARRPITVIDLLAILPFFLVFTVVDLRVLRAARLFRLVRLLKAGRYISALSLIRTVVHEKREELVLAGALMAVLLVIASSVMYFAENAAQPEKFSSIPASMWWAVATLTTVGYGDVYPVTPIGRIAGACISIAGIGFFALPTAILGAGFAEAVKAHRSPHCCPHCGRELT